MKDWASGLLTVTPAAPVYAADGATLFGVVGIDMDFTVIEESILGLRVVGEEGYAYLLTPTADGVAVHPGLDPADVPSILDLEDGVDEDEFGEVLAQMTEECSGSASYQKNGATWLISWEHEKVSLSGIGGSSGVSSVCSTGGFIVAVTVSEAALLGVRLSVCGGRTSAACLFAFLSLRLYKVLLHTHTLELRLLKSDLRYLTGRRRRESDG